MSTDSQELDKLNFLNQVIDIVYSNYKEKPFLMSVFNFKKQLSFTTNFTKKVYNFPLYGESYNDYNLSNDEKVKTDLFHETASKVLDICINSGVSATLIIFDEVRHNWGALHTTFTPIFTPDGAVCGVLSQSYEFTKLFFGCINWNNDPDVSFDVSKLELLTKRQADILYLLAINFSQEEIAQMLQIKRGTVSAVINQISIKVNCQSYSITVVLDFIGRANILATLKPPKIKIPTKVIYFVHKY